MAINGLVEDSAVAEGVLKTVERSTEAEPLQDNTACGGETRRRRSSAWADEWEEEFLGSSDDPYLFGNGEAMSTSFSSGVCDMVKPSLGAARMHGGFPSDEKHESSQGDTGDNSSTCLESHDSEDDDVPPQPQAGATLGSAGGQRPMEAGSRMPPAMVAGSMPPSTYTTSDGNVCMPFGVMMQPMAGSPMPGDGTTILFYGVSTMAYAPSQMAAMPPPPPPPATHSTVSIGSVGHPNTCAAPCKYAKKRGCKDGAQCTRCHLCAWSRHREKYLSRRGRKEPRSGMHSDASARWPGYAAV
mmetsp:Transcript_114908/g.332034  ORF Transcript_114908/g.332034 Transcript_114908/m.332034 type:complete len:299 (-) Transcript_114908:61-957(-)